MGAIRSRALESKKLSQETKMKVYNACIVTTHLLYGCELWYLQTRHKSRLQVVQMKYLGRVLGVTRLDRVNNEEL